MATQEEIIKLVMKVEGQADAAFLRGEIAKLERQIVSLSSVGVTAASPAMQGLANAMIQAGKDADALEAKFGKVGRSQTGAMNAVQGTSRAFQDFTSAAMNGGIAQGFNAITNNVDQVATGFASLAGATPAMAAAIGSIGTFAIVGLQILIPVIEQAAQAVGFFADSIDPTITKVESLTGRIKELGEQKVKTEYDRTELESLESDLKRVKAAKASLDTVMQLRPDKEEASSKAVMGVLKESPQTAAGVMNALIKAETSDEKIAADPAYSGAKEKIARLRAEATRIQTTAEGGGMPTFGRDASRREEAAEIEKTLPEIKRRAIQAGVDRVSAMMSTADPGKQGEKVESLAGALDKIGETGLAGKVRESSPEKMQEKRKEELAKKFSEEGSKLDEMVQDEFYSGSKQLKKKADASNKFEKAGEKLEDAIEDEFFAISKALKAAGLVARKQELKIRRAEDKANAASINEEFARGHLGMSEKQWIQKGKDDSVRRERAAEQLLGDQSGIANPIAMRMYQARFSGRGSMNDLNMQRRFSRMTDDERQRYEGARNDMTDEALVQQGTRWAMTSKMRGGGGITRDRTQAEAIIRAQVAEQRKRFNEMNGDAPTKAQDDNTKAIEVLTKAVVGLASDGVALKLDD